MTPEKLQRLIGDWITCSPEFVDDCDHLPCNLERLFDENNWLRVELLTRRQEEQ